VAFVTGSASAEESTQLWVRSLADSRFRLLDGANGAHLPFWSPDSTRIAFFAHGKLNTMPAEGGRVDVLCDAPDGRGGSWSSAGVIVFAPTSAGPLARVAVQGGEPSAATTLDAGRKETGHRFPFFLPDGRHFLFAALPGNVGQFDLFVGSLDGPDRTLVTTAQSAAVYVDPGYLFFARKGVVVAQPFDAKRLQLSGDPTILDDAPGNLGNRYSSAPAVSASADAFVYLHDPFGDTRLVWVDREGRELGTVRSPAARYLEVRLSPDNQRAAVVRYASATKSTIWVLDLTRNGASKIADNPGLNYNVVWSADGKRLAYTNDGSGTENIFSRDAAGAMPEAQLYASPDLFKKPHSWSIDGTILFTQLSPDTANDLVAVSGAGGAKAVPYVHESSNEDLGQFSPDGRWVAYVSDEAGSADVYVRSFPTPDRKHRVTTDGGTWAAWNAAGTELLIVGADGRQLKTADVHAGADLSIGIPKVVGALPNEAVAWDASRDLQRLLVVVPASGSAGLSLTVVTDWLAAVKKR
jgi:Tol biopolymer transport system component